MHNYTPIPCHFYDELEALAVKKEQATIIYRQDNEEKVLEDIIVDFKTKNKEEFMILKSGLVIRLDYIISVNGKELKGYC